MTVTVVAEVAMVVVAAVAMAVVAMVAVAVEAVAKEVVTLVAVRVAVGKPEVVGQPEEEAMAGVHLAGGARAEGRRVVGTKAGVVVVVRQAASKVVVAWVMAVAETGMALMELGGVM